jgi:hypothetical protein
MVSRPYSLIERLPFAKALAEFGTKLPGSYTIPPASASLGLLTKTTRAMRVAYRYFIFTLLRDKKDIILS